MSDITVIDYHKNRAIGYLNEAARNIILVGHELIAIKAELEHTKWSEWVEENLHIKQRQAYNWMKLAKESNTNVDLKRIHSLSTSVQVLFLEADPEVQQKVIEKVEKGETVNIPQLLEMKRLNKNKCNGKMEKPVLDNNCGIYLLTDISTGVNYVGQSKNLDIRKKEHMKNKGEYWNFYILRLCEECDLNNLENYYINLFKLGEMR
jgi:Protein of unknown function (DUF3102)/GIY-YIG catalytic domain